jgi:hypothetical protein
MLRFLVIVIDMLLALYFGEQVIAFLVHLRVFTATIGCGIVIVVHLVVVDVVAVSVGGRIDVSKNNNLDFLRMLMILNLTKLTLW